MPCSASPLSFVYHLDGARDRHGRGQRWIPGSALSSTQSREFAALLDRMQHERAFDRKGAAAEFMFRLGRASAPALLLALTGGHCPSLAAETTQYLFSDEAFVTGIAVRPESNRQPPRGLPLRAALARARVALQRQHEPVIAALARWAPAQPRYLWGQSTAAFAMQWLALSAWLGSATRAVRLADHFFAGQDIISATRPAFVRTGGRTSLYTIQRSTCCRYHRLPRQTYCQSCPLHPLATAPRRFKKTHQASVGAAVSTS